MRILAAVVVGASMLFGGCAMGPNPLTGFFYSDVKYPGWYEGASERGVGSKSGTATATSILGLVATGDASIAAACTQGGIKTINTVDHHYTGILGVYAKWTTMVSGE
jgi:hypothetical protein